jgi:mono/diheme cytochrome c family protein
VLWHVNIWCGENDAHLPRLLGAAADAMLYDHRSATAFALLGTAGLLCGRDSPARTPNPGEGQTLFNKLCSGCHGADAHGTEQGPALAGNSRVRARSVEALRDLIHSGISEEWDATL